ncbi:hypothetical protein D3C81_1472150 [compost metagenome]
MEFNIDDVRMLVEEDKIQWRNHILIRMQQRGIKIKDVLDCIMCGEIIEFYKDDYPFPSALILGFKDKETGMHVVCSIGQTYLWMITAYYPDKSQWSKDLRYRRR